MAKLKRMALCHPDRPYYVKNWCSACYQANCVTKHPEERKIYDAKHRAANKLEVLTYYGPQHRLCCSDPDCFINNINMLTLDHINNNGSTHRKEIGGSNNMCRWIKRNGFPEGFQTLCWNHQWEKEILLRKSKE